MTDLSFSFRESEAFALCLTRACDVAVKNEYMLIPQKPSEPAKRPLKHEHPDGNPDCGNVCSEAHCHLSPQ